MAEEEEEVVAETAVMLAGEEGGRDFWDGGKVFSLIFTDKQNDSYNLFIGRALVGEGF